MTVGDLLADAEARLRAAGIEDTPRLDAELLLGEAASLTREHFAARPSAEVAPEAARAFEVLLARREAREPIAYILGRRGFRWIELELTPDVLIPRPETELLVEVALKILKDRAGPSEHDRSEFARARVLDVGTGSGAVALAVAQECEGAEVVATDTSAAALALARANAERLGLSGRVRFEEGTVPAGEFDLILANLPYVETEEIDALEPELAHEPRGALDGGPDGLRVIRDVIPQAVAALADGGTVALEVGEGQAEAVARLLESASLRAAEAHRDLAGIERVVTAAKRR